MPVLWIVCPFSYMWLIQCLEYKNNNFFKVIYPKLSHIFTGVSECYPDIKEQEETAL